MKDFNDDIDILNKIMNNFFGNDNFTGGYKFSDKSYKHKQQDNNYISEDVSIFQDDKHIYITAELRVPDEDMKITPQKDGLIIEAMLDGSWRRWKINIPSTCIPKSAKITYVNGVLDVTLDIVENNDEI